MSKRSIVPSNRGRGDNLPTKRTTPTKKKDYNLDWLRDVTIFNAGGEEKVTKPYSQSAAVYAAVSSIANAISLTPFRIYDWETEEANYNHPLNILFDRPSAYLSRSQLWNLTSTFLFLKGECFWYMVPSRGQVIGTSQTPGGIVVIDPDLMKHSMSRGNELIGWVFNNTVPLSLNEVIHYKLSNPYNPIRGLSPIETIRIDMDSDYLSAKFNYKFYGNSARPDGIIEIPDELSEDAYIRLKREWNEKYQGQENAHKLAVLEGGGKYTQMGLSQKDMDFINQRRLSREQIFMAYKTPEVITGVTSSNLNRATAFANKLVFQQNTVEPAMVLLEDTLYSQFLIPTYGYPPPVYGAFDRKEALGMEDKAIIAGQYFNVGIPMAAINRRLELGFTEQEISEEYLPFNIVPRGLEDPTDLSMPSQNLLSEDVIEVKEIEHKQEFTPIQKQSQRVFQRIVGTQERKLGRKLKKYIFDQRKKVLAAFSEATKSVTKQTAEEYAALVNELGQIWEEEEQILRNTVEPNINDSIDAGAKYGATAIGIEAGAETLRAGVASDLLNSRLNRITGITNTIRRNVSSQISEGFRSGESLQQIEQRIKNVYTFTGNRAKIIARTETAGVINEAAHSVFMENGVAGKRWITAGDDKVRETHIDASNDGVIPLDQTFSNGLAFPGDPSGSAAEVINCRCALVPEVGS